ncbi:uncharacterized protein LOC123548568 [Mercenaria mercenaria]|uniref:uncharacterized protein LOC123548568 n=1 Tax=Mercenaria mercenaria TaxID=6596 RepID=UPI00234F1B18|nr:uncharacterized protein LOC123548568 [Mercenaria mercenaria]XP_045191869.2 uncharacterized protein LOC123548568 [Mercenaria mercenaria]
MKQVTMEKDRQIPNETKRLSSTTIAAHSKETILTNGCEDSNQGTHTNFQRQTDMMNGHATCVAIQCNGNNLVNDLELEENEYLQDHANDQRETNDRKKKNNGKKDMKITMNGIDVRLNGTGYSRTVCNVYRHENDLIFGRTRGGVVSNQGTVIANHVANSLGEISPPVRTNGHVEEVVETLRESSENGKELQELTAPLATPESFSDDDSVHEDGNQSPQACNGSNEQTLEQLTNVNNVSHEPSAEVVSQVGQSLSINGSEIPLHMGNEVLNSGESSDSLICDDFDQEVIDLDDVKENGAQDDSVSTDSDLGCLMDNLDFENNQDEEQVQEVENVEVQETEVDNNDDIGDFIEADLPPNVERLAFFSRDSTSDEDEGCGDEVLPNNDEDIVSDNETIDPTDGGYMSPSRMNEQKVLNSEQSSNGACNVLSAASNSVRGEMSNLYPCNISCDKSTEENDDYVSSLECRCSEECAVVECASCNELSHDRSSSGRGDRDSNIGNGDNLCACCDKPIVVDSQRHQELGVDVCDKCFKELNAEQSRWFENGAKHRTWPGSRSSSSNNFLNRNCGNVLMPLNNNYEKVSNNSFICARFSSSDSDPYDRIYVSDSSEMISPDTETGTESVFHSSSLTSSGGTVVQSNQSREDRNRGDSRHLHRQSISLDFTSPEEVLYCPYYTRRSRSLDQELLQFDDCIHGDDRPLESDEPNIAISSSNFQDDEINTQEKVFEKQPYNVPVSLSNCNLPVPIPSCSSSDEEENMRMPGASNQDMAGVSVFDMDNFDIMPQSELAANLELANDNMLYGPCSKGKHSRGHKMRMDDNEPIYEDIDQLELLLEDSERDSEITRTTQPLCSAITKLRRKRRTRSPVSDVEKVMIWNEYEAYVVQVKQIGTSACGPTAVLNVLKAFDFQVEKEEVAHTIRSNLRMEAAPIPYYLFSRYNAGTTAQDLVDGVTSVTRGAIRGRFFHFYPPREIELLKWLGHWMKKGAVPVATLNLQRGVKPGWTIPDAWHHQMVYGVSSKGIYLTNPLEIVPESVIMEQLTSDSVLLVRRQDVVGRFRDWCPLNEIIKQRDPRWRTMNVLGQVVHMLREQYMPAEQMITMKSQLTSHVSIPAAYKAGIILFMRGNCQSMEDLLAAPELPMKCQQAET